MRDGSEQSTKFARDLRSRLTDAEMILWSRLRRTQVGGLRFRRQHPIGPFIADFACVSARLVIEVDGATHATKEERAYDARRDQFMEGQGWRVVRFQNDDVYRELDGVLQAILHYATSPHRLPSIRSADTSPAKAGEET